MHHHTHTPYIGRFAPSPSGALHFGSLLTALASYLDAKANHGQWLLRIDNIDPHREPHDTAEKILFDLEAFGLHWDGAVIYQSTRAMEYMERCVQWIEQDLVYPCDCSRKALTAISHYPNTCRKQLSPTEKHTLIECLRKDYKNLVKDARTLAPQLTHSALRLNTAALECEQLAFTDALFGEQQAPNTLSDFILIRKDRLPSYMLACGLDELRDNITHVVRGADLLHSSFWQRALQISAQGHVANIHFAHLPLVVNALGQKLSKQHHAPALDVQQKSLWLFKALCALNQQPDPQLVNADCHDILAWGVKHWQLKRIHTRDIAFDTL